jgi:hypothetical protein
MPGSEQRKLVNPYTIATVTLAETVKPKRKEIAKAVVSLTPQPPILTGRVIENNIIGAKTKKLKISILRSSEYAQIIYVVIYVNTIINDKKKCL